MPPVPPGTPMRPENPATGEAGSALAMPEGGSGSWMKNSVLANGKVPQDLMSKLPPAESYKKAVFPSVEDQAAGKEVITKQWDSVVGANVQ